MASFARVLREAILIHPPRPARWLDLEYTTRACILLIVLAISAGIALRLSGWVGGAYSWFFLSGAGDDSWLPMGLAYERVTGQHPGTLRELFFTEHVKFQYPASSLLLYSALDLMGISPSVKALNAIVWLSILATPFVIFQLCVTYIDKSAPRISQRDKYVIAAGFALATLFFYPIMIAWRLGQVQALLNLAFALACLCWVSDRKIASGALIGVSCLIKPQFGLFLLWGALRRESGFAAGQAIVLGFGLLLSLMLYGWQNNIYYLDVLQYVSQRGETFWDNTSINGLMNGLAHPDQVLRFNYGEFPPYDPTVYIATLLSSLAIIAAALFFRRNASSEGNSVLDFMTAGLSFTLAAPIAWGHHYGIAMPILAIVFIEIARLAPDARQHRFLIGWGMCFLLLNNYWNVSEMLAGTSAALFQNWRLIAVLGLLWTLYRLQARPVALITPAAQPRTMGV
jgi:alpha-1,2-mannosyltransferase